jgi:hypothetical protein
LREPRIGPVVEMNALMDVLEGELERLFARDDAIRAGRVFKFEFLLKPGTEHFEGVVHAFHEELGRAALNKLRVDEQFAVLQAYCKPQSWLLLNIKRFDRLERRVKARHVGPFHALRERLFKSLQIRG